MRAVGMAEFGGPDVLRVIDLPAPEPGPHDVVVRTTAAAVNPTDTGMRAGKYEQRLAETAGPPPYVPGMDVSGMVVATGEAVDRVAIGDAVMGAVNPRRPEGGAYAELVVLPAASVVRVPDGVGLLDAATVPMNALTALRALDLLDLGDDEVLGVTGAAGVLGRFVTSLARHRGLTVVADAAERDRELVEAAGATTVVERGPDVARRMRELHPGGVDAVVDASVQEDEALAAVRDGGQLVTVRGWDAPDDRGVTVHRVSVWDYLERADRLDEVAARVADGTLAGGVVATYTADEAAQAHRRFEQGGVRGRLLIVFAE